MGKGRDIKPHIGIFGRRNNGKSSFINMLLGQDVAIVSSLPGTTTDPVKKSIEIFGIGPAVIIDTAGIDDVGEVGAKRIAKSLETLKTIDAAILIISENRFDHIEKELIAQFLDFDIPFFIIHNKNDIEPLREETIENISAVTSAPILDFNTLTPSLLEKALQLLKETVPASAYQKMTLFDDLIHEKEIILLVTPIDNEAPEGRLILPQVMAIRDILDHHAVSIVLQDTELEDFLKKSNILPALVVTDSQIFEKVSAIVPEDIPLTGFSLLFARLKGNFEAFIEGTPTISKLKEGDKVLIMESCTHHVNCDDIGRVKLPQWLEKFSGKKLNFEVVSSFQQTKEDISHYAIVIQCGGCMFTRKQVMNRLKPAIDQGIPVSNYGMAIAYMHGIFERATAIFKHFQKESNINQK